MHLGMGFIHLVISVIISCFMLFLFRLIFRAIKKKSGKELKIGNKVAYFTLFVVVSILSGMFADGTAVIYDRITLTALGEKNDSASSDEVRLNGIFANDKQWEIRTPVEGKWFWAGDDYMWRNENDSRQPKGTTRTIILEIPAGINRKLTFSTCEWRGIVEVKCGENSYTVDTSLVQNVELPQSTPSRLMLSLAVYALVNIGFLALMGSAVGLLTASYVKTNEKTYHLRYYFTYAAIALSSMLIYMPLSTKYSFWGDEIWQIGFSGCGNSLYDTLVMGETSPPLYRLIANIWYNIVPYGEGWLLLLSGLFAVGGIYVMGLLGKEYRNAYVGIICSALSATSYFVCAYALEFRAYTLLFFLSAIYMLFTLKRIKKGTTAGWRDYIICAVIGILLAYTHYYGIFLLVCTFFIDVFLLIKKRIKLSAFFVYLIPLVAYIPWLKFFLEKRFIGLSARWQASPSVTEVIELFKTLSGSNAIVQLLLIFGASFALIYMVKQIRLNKRNFLKKFTLFFPLAEIILLIFIMFIYGKFLNTNASLWVARYFMVIFPAMMLLIGSGFEVAVNHIVKQYQYKKKTFTKALSLLALSIYTFSVTYSTITTTNFKADQHYRESATWIYSKTNYIYSDKTIVIFYDSVDLGNGWYEYYAIKQGIRDGFVFINIKEIPTDYVEFLSQYNNVFILHIRGYLFNDASIYEYIKENYELQDSGHQTDLYIRKKD